MEQWSAWADCFLTCHLTNLSSYRYRNRQRLQMNYDCEAVQRELCKVPRCEDLVIIFQYINPSINSLCFKSTIETTSRAPFNDDYDPYNESHRINYDEPVSSESIMTDLSILDFSLSCDCYLYL